MMDRLTRSPHDRIAGVARSALSASAPMRTQDAMPGSRRRRGISTQPALRTSRPRGTIGVGAACGLLLAVALLALGASAWAQPGHDLTPVEDPSKHAHMQLTADQRAELKKATRTVLCYCGCPPTLVDECICGTARDIKDDMALQLVAGTTPEEIAAAYVAEFGTQYMAAPPKEGFNLVIWIFPAFAFAGLSALFWALISRLVRLREPATQPAASSELTEYQQQIERELSERKDA